MRTRHGGDGRANAGPVPVWSGQAATSPACDVELERQAQLRAPPSSVNGGHESESRHRATGGRGADGVESTLPSLSPSPLAAVVSVSSIAYDPRCRDDHPGTDRGGRAWTGQPERLTAKRCGPDDASKLSEPAPR